MCVTLMQQNLMISEIENFLFLSILDFLFLLNFPSYLVYYFWGSCYQGPKDIQRLIEIFSSSWCLVLLNEIDDIFVINIFVTRNQVRFVFGIQV